MKEGGSWEASGRGEERRIEAEGLVLPSKYARAFPLVKGVDLHERWLSASHGRGPTRGALENFGRDGLKDGVPRVDGVTMRSE